MAKLEGGCFCGAVRYRLREAPLFVNACHCRQCQSQTGSAFVINAIIELANVELKQGKLEVVPMSEARAYPHDIHRCRKCRVAVWSDYGRGPFRFVRVGTLDQPGRLKPQAHIFTRSKLSWVKLPDGVPAFDTFYEAHTLWPKKSLARLEAMKRASK
jgi:hypothetical protein